jgi:hydrogenase maturation protease
MSAKVVVGLGQPYGGDDAVGWAVIAALEGRAGAAELVRSADPASLLELLDRAARLVVVDALLAPPAGAVRLLTAAELLAGPRPVSSHALSLADALSLARAMGAATPVAIVGVTIERAIVPSRRLSPPVAAAVEPAVRCVLALLAGPPLR